MLDIRVEPPIDLCSVAPAVLSVWPLNGTVPNHVLFGFNWRCRYDPEDYGDVKNARSGGLSDRLDFAKDDIARVHFELIQPFVATHGLE